MEVRATIDDPKAFTKPWTTTTQKMHLLFDTEILEFSCNENEKDIQHLVTIVMAFRLVLTALAAAAILGAQAPAPDLVLSNGKIITVDERFTIAQAVAIHDDRIMAVGTNQEIARLAGPNTRRIDLRGRAVIPGLIDNHMHLLRAAATWLRETRFDGVESRKQAIEMLRAHAKAVGPGEWVYNIGGWTHQQFVDDPKPFTREELDRAAPDNPVALQESYYQVDLNSRALDIFKIEANAPDPQGFQPG